MDDQFKAAALVGMLFGQEMLLALYRKGALSAREAYELCDKVLLNLEQHQTLFRGSEGAFATARRIIEAGMQEIRNAPDFS